MSSSDLGSSTSTLKHLSDEKVYSETCGCDLDKLEQASVILWTIWKTINPDRFGTLTACTDALKECGQTGELYRVLRICHERRRYDRIRKWVCAPALINSLAHLPVEDTPSEFLTALRPSIALLVNGQRPLPTWSPDPRSAQTFESRTLSHLRNLKVPCIKGRGPNLLLHQLGCFSYEPALQSKMHDIFQPGSPTHTILINTSGSGKTRLLLEGLCENWGFYFTSAVDSSSLGSSDLQNTIEKTIPNNPNFTVKLPLREYEAKLGENEKIAAELFKRVFLARVLLFDLFVQTMNDVIDLEPVEEYRRRWLHFQLQPRILEPKFWDPFNDLAQKLESVSDANVDTMTYKILTKTRAALAKGASAEPLSTEGLPLYCVIDEAQHAATMHLDSFRSSSSKNTTPQPRPILRSLVQTISKLTLGQGIFLVLAGTGLSQSSVESTLASAVMKEARYRWCYETGSFQGWDGMASWVGRIVPEWVLSGERGERLKERMGYWLTGRHRFVAGYMEELLVHGFRQPHRLLNAYVRQFTEFEPTDGKEVLEEEKLEGCSRVVLQARYKLDFAKLAANSAMISMVHHITTHYIMRSILPGPLGTDELLFVQHGFARFRFAESDANRRTTRSQSKNMAGAIDEPLVLLAMYHWTDNNAKSHMSTYRYFARHIKMHCAGDAPSNGFENLIVYCIDLLFASKPRRVKDVFHFHGKAPAWAFLHAELISLYDLQHSYPSRSPSPPIIEQALVKHARYSGPSAVLGTNAETAESTLDWLSHGSRVPVCFPSPRMGPDIMFVLKLAGGKLVWVALQTKLCKLRTLDTEEVKEAVRSVTPKYFFLDKHGRPFSPKRYPNLVPNTLEQLANLPNRCEEAGKYSLLRAIASFPARADLRRCNDSTDPSAAENLQDIDDHHPIATLNMELIKELTKTLPPQNFLESMEPTKAGRSGKKIAGRKRKQGQTATTGEGADAPRKRKIKL